MNRLTLTLFGGLEVRAGSVGLLTVPTRKAQALLAYLAFIPGHAHSRDKLAALLWPDTSPGAARTALRQTLFILRKALGPAESATLVMTGDAITLAAEAVATDVSAFEQAVAEGTPASLERAAALYRGDLLAGLGVVAPTFEDWLMSERERLRELALEALARLLAHQRSTGATAAAIQSALRLLALDPLQEAVHRTLMRLYVQLGRRDTALRQYQDCVELLRRELAVEPERETKDLYQEILRQRPVTEPVVTLSVGPADSPLVGREVELTSMRQALAEAWTGRGRVVAVGGEAGIGKTRLLAELAAEAGRRGGAMLLGRAYESEQILPFGPWVSALRDAGVLTDPHVLADLESVWRTELARLLPELADTDVPTETTAPNQLRLFEALAQMLRRVALGQPLLVVLEDCHWADDMTLRFLAFVARRLHASPILVALSVRDEELLPDSTISHTLDELASESRLSRVSLSRLGRDDTLALVRLLDRTATTPSVLSERGDEIWKASEGNPFIAVETVRAISQGVLITSPGNVPVPARVRDMIGRRLDRLSDRGQELARLAAVIERQFEFALLHQASGLDERSAADGVEELVRRRILRAVGERFELVHERVREVVWDRLLRPRRMLLHRQVAAALETLYAGDPTPHYPALVTHCREGELWLEAVHYLTRLAATAARRHALDEARAALQEASLHATRLPVDRRDRTLIDLAFRQVLCLNQQGRLPESLDVLRAQHERIEQIADPVLGARHHFWLGYVWCAFGKSDRAVASLTKSAEQAVSSGDTMIEGMAHCTLALEAAWAGRFAEGVARSRRAIALLESAGPSAWLATSHLHLGVNWYHLGRFDVAVEAADRGAVMADALHDPHLQSYSAWVAGLSLGARGDWQAGIDAAERAIAAAGTALDRALAGAVLGYVHIRRRDAARAIAALGPAVEALARFQYARFHGIYSTVLGEAHFLAGDVARAQALAREGLDVTRRAGYAFGVGFSQRLLGRLAAAAGELGQASQGLESALQTFTAIGAEFEAARTRLELAALAEACDDPDRAATHARAALQVFTALATPLYAERARAAAPRVDGVVD